MTDDGPLLDPTGQYILRSPRTGAEMREAQEATDRAEQRRADRRQAAEQLIRAALTWRDEVAEVGGDNIGEPAHDALIAAVDAYRHVTREATP